MMYWKISHTIKNTFSLHSCATRWKCKNAVVVFCYIILAIMVFLAQFGCKVSQVSTPIVHTECDSLYFDLDTGMVNAVSPVLPQADIKEWFTCFTHSFAPGAPDHCAGGVVYGHHGFYYNTYFDYVEASEKFKGQVSHSLLKSARANVYIYYQSPVKSRFVTDSNNVDLFPTSYGCLVFQYSNDHVSKIGAYFMDCGEVDLCQLKEFEY